MDSEFPDAFATSDLSTGGQVDAAQEQDRQEQHSSDHGGEREQAERQTDSNVSLLACPSCSRDFREEGEAEEQETGRPKRPLAAQAVRRLVQQITGKKRKSCSVCRTPLPRQERPKRSRKETDNNQPAAARATGTKVTMETSELTQSEAEVVITSLCDFFSNPEDGRRGKDPEGRKVKILATSYHQLTRNNFSNTQRQKGH